MQSIFCPPGQSEPNPRRPKWLKYKPKFDKIEPCGCTRFGHNDGFDRNGDKHDWVLGECWPRPLEFEIKRLHAEGVSVEDLSARYRLLKSNVAGILDGTRKLDLSHPSCWLWVDPNMKPYPFEYLYRHTAVLKIISQGDLIALYNVQKQALHWVLCCITGWKNRIHAERYAPAYYPLSVPGWRPHMFGHVMARKLVNQMLQYKATLKCGDLCLTTDGRVLVNGTWYSRVYRRDKQWEEEDFRGKIRSIPVYKESVNKMEPDVLLDNMDKTGRFLKQIRRRRKRAGKTRA